MKFFSSLFFIIQFEFLFAQKNIPQPLEWDVTPIFLRGIYGQILDSNTVELHCIFRVDTSMIVVFDYNDILTGKEWDTHCYTSMKGIISNAEVSQIIIESEFGEMIPLSDNINFPSFKGYLKKEHYVEPTEFNFDLFAVEYYYHRSFKLSLSIPIHSLKICQDNEKIRFHYFYKAKKKYLEWSPNDYLFSSDWFSISDIR